MTMIIETLDSTPNSQGPCLRCLLREELEKLHGTCGELRKAENLMGLLAWKGPEPQLPTRDHKPPQGHSTRRDLISNHFIMFKYIYIFVFEFKSVHVYIYILYLLWEDVYVRMCFFKRSRVRI